MAGHILSVQKRNQKSFIFFSQNYFLSLKIEMFEQFHGVFVSQEGGSIQREGSNLENTGRLMISIDQ